MVKTDQVTVILWILKWNKSTPMLKFKDISGGVGKKISKKIFLVKKSKDLCILSTKSLNQWVHDESLDFIS